ncbi:hypothetical protein NMY22_g4214 [Coprinellus aureogranulatus]|nr:hypothetical protein NMY22_g4214 [Coprinellus aureogranulatus]
MAPQSWATPAERDFLLSFLPEYEACQVQRKYKNFWLKVNKDYLTKFPVVERLFPGVKACDLNDEQRDMCAGAIAKQQKRIKEWYRWQMNPRSRNAGFTISKKDLQTIYHARTRVLKPYEVFAKLFPREVEELKKRRCEEGGVKGRHQLSVWHEVAKELYQGASEMQLQAVRKEMSDGPTSDGEESHDSPKSYLRYMKRLPTLLDAAVSPAVKKAGVIALVTIVGPDPEKHGKIVCRTLQFGDKPGTPLFSNVWADHDTVFVEELARFARRHEFPPEVCAARSLTNHTLDLKVPQSPVRDPTDKASSQLPSTSASAHEQSLTESEQTGSISQGQSGEKNDESTALTALEGVELAARVGRARMIVVDSDDDELDDDKDSRNTARSSPPPVRGKDTLGLFSDDNDDNNNDEDDEEKNLDLSPRSIVEDDFGFTEVDWEIFETSLQLEKTHQHPEDSNRNRFPRFRSRSPSRSPSPLEDTGEGVSTQRSHSIENHNAVATPQPPSQKARGVPERVDSSVNPHVHARALNPASASSQPAHAPPRSSTATVSVPTLSPIPDSQRGCFASVTSLPESISQFKSLLSHPLRLGTSLPPVPIPLTRDVLAFACPIRQVYSEIDHHSERSPTQELIFSSLPETPGRLVTGNSLRKSPISVAPSFTESRPAPVAHTSQLPSPAASSTRKSAKTTTRASTPPIPAPVEDDHPASDSAFESQKQSTNLKSRIHLPASQRTSAEPPTQKQVPTDVDNGEPAPRRSARGSVPSRREEQLQMIGTNVTHVVAKKGKSGGDAWFKAALVELNAYDMGECWRNVVKKWEVLERLMGQQKAGRGTLPVEKRPEEWTKWTSKAWQGNRPYDKIPSIETPRSLAWLSPRGGLPSSPVSVNADADADQQDPWVHLRKSGINGFVTVIMLLMWWGHAAATQKSEWLEDSMPLWHRVVEDVEKVLEAMTSTFIESTSNKVGKRGRENESESTERKRSKKRARR